MRTTIKTLQNEKWELLQVREGVIFFNWCLKLYYIFCCANNGSKYQNKKKEFKNIKKHIKNFTWFISM